jgi:hypothetical protein
MIRAREAYICQARSGDFNSLPVISQADLPRVRFGARADKKPIVCLGSDNRHWVSRLSCNFLDPAKSRAYGLHKICTKHLEKPAYRLCPRSTYGQTLDS